MRKAVLLLLALLAGNLWSVVSEQPLRPQTLPGRDPLRRFVEEVLTRTRPGDSILFIVPPDDADGGLVNHRLRYALPGRYVSTNRDLIPPGSPPPQWRAVWRGADGVLERVPSR